MNLLEQEIGLYEIKLNQLIETNDIFKNEESQIIQDVQTFIQ